MKLKTAIAALFLAALSLLTLTPEGRAIGGNILSAARINFTNAGALSWMIRQNSSGQLQVVENTNAVGAVLTLDDGTGAVGLRTRTATQLSTLAPAAANQLVIQSNTPALCISTGTGAGAWIYASTNTHKNPCYNL